MGTKWEGFLGKNKPFKSIFLIYQDVSLSVQSQCKWNTDDTDASIADFHGFYFKYELFDIAGIAILKYYLITYHLHPFQLHWIGFFRCPLWYVNASITVYAYVMGMHKYFGGIRFSLFLQLSVLINRFGGSW